MRREPDETDLITIGITAVVVDSWVDPEDESHEDIFGEPAEPGTEGWCLSVCAHVTLAGERFEGRASLGGVWIRNDTDGQTYLQEELVNLRCEATLALLEEIRQISDGRDIPAVVVRAAKAAKLRKAMT